jgi:ribosomal protein L44E
VVLTSTERRFCPTCQHETNHVVVLVDKSYGKQVKPEQKRKEFIKDFITGWAAGPFLANMDRFERHVICESCGKKVIDE